MELAMATSFAPQPAERHGPDPATGIVVGLIAGIAVLTLIVAGITFAALAVAFPIAVPIAQAWHLPIAAADEILAERFAAFWWAFAALAAASFGAALVIVVKLIGFLSPAPRD
jgi:hypothetical protein